MIHMMKLREDIIAIGDGDNDIDMIKYADIVTKYFNNNDGVYEVIKNILKNGVRYYNEL